MSLNRYAIDLPWPSRVLHPNERPHYMAKARATKAARQAAAFMAKPIGRIDADSIKVTSIFSPPPIKRSRDLDGLLSSCKPYFDGIADVIGIDDSKWLHQAPLWDAPRKGGNVRIEIEAVDAWEQAGDVASRVLAAIPSPKRSAA